MANVSLAMKVFGCESDWNLEPGYDARTRLAQLIAEFAREPAEAAA